MSKLDKKTIILICCIVVVIIIMLVVFLVSKTNSNNDNKETTTTTTTSKVTKEKLTYKEDKYNITLEIEENEVLENTERLVVSELEETLKVENLIKVYDISLYDKDNNIVSVKNANIIITIPYEEVTKYDSYNVLYLSDSSEVLETIPATYLNGYIKFTVNHLSRYAIVGVNSDETTTTSTTRKTTTKAPTTTTTTTKQIETTTKKAEETITTTTTQAATTTKTTTTKTTTTEATTTQKVKSYSYKWSTEGDQGGKYFLYVVDENGNYVNGTVTLTSKASGKSAAFDIPTEGRLFVKDNYVVSNPKGK